jgi:uncharacterized coiled-coil DUF342 family protein
MEGIDEIKARIDALLAKRHELVQKAKKTNSAFLDALQARGALSGFLKGKNLPSAGRLYRLRNKIEFRISTEAYTPKLEKEFIEQLQKVEKELEGAKKGEWLKRKFQQAQEKFASVSKEKAGLDGELAKIRGELDELFKKYRAMQKAKRREETAVRVREGKKRRVQEERERMRREHSEHFNRHEKYVSLEEICVIEKNGKEEEK